MRRYYLDNIRSFAVIGVIIFHSIYVFSGLTPSYGSLGSFHNKQTIDYILYLLYPWILSILFVISGISSKIYLEKHNDKEFIKSRTVKLLVPSTLGLLTFHFISGYYNAQITDAFNYLEMTFPYLVDFTPDAVIYVFAGIGILWFIQLLWLLSLILIPIKNILKDKVYKLFDNTNIYILILLVIPFCLFSQLLNIPYAIPYRIGCYFFLYLIGYYIFSNENTIDILIKNINWLVPFSLILLGIYAYKTYGYNPMVKPYVNSFIACITTWFLILSILAIGKKYMNKTNKFFEFIKKESWGFYLFHYTPLIICAYNLHYSSFGDKPYICYPLTFLSSFIGSYILDKIIRSIPFYRFFVMGIKKK